MTWRVAANVTAAAVLCLTAFAVESSAQSGRIEIEEDTPIYLVGCIQRESEFRRENDSGKGGFLGTGAGLGNEYVLMNASRGESGSVGDCNSGAAGDVYELTGSGEKDLERFVGQRVAINGILKKADLDAATGRPTGGIDPVGQDLRLFEVEIKSASALPPAPESTVALAPQEPVGTTETRNPRLSDAAAVDEELPRTASPLPLMGLLGLLAVGGAAGLRARYRLDRRQFR
jgi:hypothetical protein